MGLIICEYGFEEPDPNRPEYSRREVDFYARAKGRDHRLSLRKNLRTGKFELYRFYYDRNEEEVIFSGSLEDALKVGHEEWMKHWGCLGEREPDKPCLHKYPQIDVFFCPYVKKRNS